MAERPKPARSRRKPPDNGAIERALREMALFMHMEDEPFKPQAYETAADEVAVLPDAPLRQWVLTLPYALRSRIAYDRRLLPRLYRIFYSSIQRFYQRRLAQLGHPNGRTGSVTAIQRASSDLRLNPHLHGVFIDGVYVQDEQGELSLTALPALSELDVQELLQSISARMLGYLRRHGLLTDDDTALAATQDGDDEQMVLEALATAAVTGTSLAGPQSRPRRVPNLQEASEQPRTTSPLCAIYAGFSLHARTTVEHDDKAGRQRLIKYILRPPLAAERVERLEGGRVRLRLKRNADAIHRFLTHLGLPTEIPRPAPARGPPYYRGKVHRVRARGGQQELLA